MGPPRRNLTKSTMAPMNSSFAFQPAWSVPSSSCSGNGTVVCEWNIWVLHMSREHASVILRWWGWWWDVKSSYLRLRNPLANSLTPWLSGHAKLWYVVKARPRSFKSQLSEHLYTFLRKNDFLKQADGMFGSETLSYVETSCIIAFLVW